MLLVCFAAGSAFADEGGEDSLCQEECKEARHICRKAAHAVHRICDYGCGDEISAATQRARAFCEEEGLEGRECARVIRRAVHAAKDECREDCASARKRARNVCHDEIKECKRACRPPIDRECAGECRDDFAGCEEDLEGCVDGCAVAKKEAVEACREQIADVCDPEAYKACVKEARVEARMCAEACHGEISCGEDLRECLGGCVIDDEPEPEEDEVKAR